MTTRITYHLDNGKDDVFYLFTDEEVERETRFADAHGFRYELKRVPKTVAQRRLEEDELDEMLLESLEFLAGVLELVSDAAGFRKRIEQTGTVIESTIRILSGRDDVEHQAP